MPGKRKPPPHVDLDFTLRRVFGIPNFRPMQRDVIIAALNGEDVFVQAATSFGKSLCFQLPAVIDHGITIVVSPLLALMNNQVALLQRSAIVVHTLNSTTPAAQRRAILADLRCGHPRTRLLYLTPETLTAPWFRSTLATIHTQGELARVAIDEAHCISAWGHDFRPAFAALRFLRAPDSPCADVPLMLLTATATPRVRTDIFTTLGLHEETVRRFDTPAHRPNLHLEVRYTRDELDTFADLAAWLARAAARRTARLHTAGAPAPGPLCGIIYAPTRALTESLAARLRAESHIGASPYHAGMPAPLRAATLAAWAAGAPDAAVVVATSAFGMGVDKPDVRFVVHWRVPDSLEAYYQEAGRAGRDGRAAVCVAYYAREDRDRVAGLVGRESGKGGRGDAAAAARQAEARGRSFQALVRYCESAKRCRHRMVCEYFGDGEAPKCELACDVCKDAAAVRRRKEEGLASEEWCSTQRECGAYDVDAYDC